MLVDERVYLGKTIKEYIKNNPCQNDAKTLFRRYKNTLKDNTYYYFYRYTYDICDFEYINGIRHYKNKGIIETCKLIKESSRLAWGYKNDVYA